MNVRLRVAWLSAAALFLLAYGAAAVLPRWSRPTAVGISIDASDSTGDDYVNLYIPTVARLLPEVVGTPVRVVRFGGVREVVYEGPLSAEDATNLRQHLLATERFGRDVRWTPITEEARDQIAWLRRQPGRRMLCILTDGIEQGPISSRRALSAKAAEGTSVLIMFPRISHPKVAEALRATGAHVVVARSPRDVAEAIELASTGLPPSLRRVRPLAFVLLLLGIACLVPGVRVVRRPQPAPAPPASPVTRKPASPLAPAKVVLTVTVGDHHRLSVQRTLRCGSGRLVVAREGAVGADLLLPYSVLGPATEVALEICPLTINRVRVGNLGEVPLAAGAQPIMPGHSRQMDVAQALRAGPNVRLELDAQPARELHNAEIPVL